jgi:hypothetical protein
VNLSAFTYRCPNTGKNVQGWTAEAIPEDPTESAYVRTQCPACARIHLVDPASGTVLGGDQLAARRPAEMCGWLAP